MPSPTTGAADAQRGGVLVDVARLRHRDVDQAASELAQPVDVVRGERAALAQQAAAGRRR